eukprot:5158227-Ditylum_brightwellii.AAC.1
MPHLAKLPGQSNPAPEEREVAEQLAHQFKDKQAQDNDNLAEMGKGLASLARDSSTSCLCLTPTSRCLAPLKGNTVGTL